MAGPEEEHEVCFYPSILLPPFYSLLSSPPQLPFNITNTHLLLLLLLRALPLLSSSLKPAAATMSTSCTKYSRTKVTMRLRCFSITRQRSWETTYTTRRRRGETTR